MTMITHSIKKSSLIHHVTTKDKSNSFWERIVTKYQTYCHGQKDMKVYWLVKAIIMLTCVYMVPSIIVMSWAIDQYVYYMGFTIILFYANIMAHVAEMKSSFYIPLYHFSCLALIIIPLTAIFMFGCNSSIL